MNKTLCKNVNEDDLFFRPKDIKKRNEEIVKNRKELISKIKLGLKNIKLNYENKNYQCRKERLFLKIFSKIRLDEKYSDKYEGYVLKNENDKIICFFNLKNDMFCVSFDNMWETFQNKFKYDYYETKSFIDNMLEKHLKLCEFAAIVKYFL